MSKFLSKLKHISLTSGNDSDPIQFYQYAPPIEAGEQAQLEDRGQDVRDREQSSTEAYPGPTREYYLLPEEQEGSQPDRETSPELSAQGSQAGALGFESAKGVRETLDKLEGKLEPVKPVLQAVGANLRQKPLHRRPLFWTGMYLFSGGCGAVTMLVALQSLERSLPPISEVFTFARQGTLTIKAADDTILQQVGDATRDKLKYDQIPEKLVQAFIAIEDRRFYEHGGVDYQGILRAVVSNLRERSVVQGASTITQQVARIVFLDLDQSAQRKIREAMLAMKIEEEMTKEQILERYLNLVYLGSGAYGVADAAWVYFGKTVDKLSLPEMATIAGLPPAPTEYSPLVNPKIALDRRNIVLREMVEAGYITPAEAEAAKNTPVKLNPKKPKRLQLQAPYFTSYIQKELPKYISKEALKKGGLTVETTLNLKWQRVAEQVVKDAVELDGPAEGFEQAAMVAIDPRDGEVKALVGGYGYGESEFNRVTQAMRQPGSTFKSFVYAAGIAAGFSPYDGYRNLPMRVDGYKPENYGKSYSGGWISMAEALAKSVNVVAVKVLTEVGFEPTIKLAHEMGIKTELKPYYALALGAIEVNLLELTNGYATLAAQGKHVPAHGIRRVIDGRGQVLYEADFKPKQVLDKDSAAIMTWMLEGVVQEGTGRPAYLGRPVAGKTGTSEEARDLWFIGYIPQLVTGVWLGNDDSYPTGGTSGTAASTWRAFMREAVGGMPVEPFPELPQLDGRKASIKAKPIPASITYYDIPAKPPQNTASTGYGAGYYDSVNSGGGYYDQGYSSPQ
ncbi:transglycosylase domain-containing protein [Kamptonema formosum]|uniref:transglycosylase domain-containing protein n=1 Tax=Kamptonema formosum TaxID=331992 RepID=UPI004048CFD6